MTTGAIHDLGYQRYVGTRRAAATRWLVIMRNHVAMAWKSWWRLKAAVGLAVIVTFIAGGFLYLAHDRIFHTLGHGAEGLATTFADGILPFSVTWYCKLGFLVSLTIGAGTIAGDAQTGAFTFYFARSVRPRDYVLGKLAGNALVCATVMLVGPLLLALLRLGLSANTDQLIGNLVVVPKTIAIGLLGTLVYAAVPLGFSAVVGTRRSATALWVAYYLVVGSMASGLAFVGAGSIGAVDLASALASVSFALFDVTLLRGHAGSVPVTAALISIGVHVTVAIVLVATRVRAAHLSGIGGAS
jgi:ABC-type transport system involved in multi-copper enzyme maturation permease subunit